MPSAPQETHILLLEDSAAYAEVIRYALTHGEMQFSLERVSSRKAFVEQLEKRPPGLILSDSSLPEFDNYAALAIARRKCPHVPFIFVTGTLGEEVAIETLKMGATDYVLKHRLDRLVPSIERALREAQEHEERLRVESQLRTSREQLRTLTFHLQGVREEERTRIAREVHDELGQPLTGLKQELNWLARQLPPQLEPLADRVKSLAKHMDATLHKVRRITTELRPSVLDSAGLLAALEWQAGKFQAQTGIQCKVRATVKTPLKDPDLNTTFFRIFQETLTNVIRHAGATRVDVRLAQASGKLVMEVKDNGRGITEAETKSTTSVGLLGMRERAALLGGEVRLRGEPGWGTTVSVRIPLPHKPSGPRSRLSAKGAPDKLPRLGPAIPPAYARAPLPFQRLIL